MWSTLLSVVLVINELMASNAGQVMSPAINFDSWIEVYNPSDEEINLGGMYLSNDAENLKTMFFYHLSAVIRFTRGRRKLDWETLLKCNGRG